MTGAMNDRVNDARQALQRKPERLQGHARSTRAAIRNRWPRRSPRTARATRRTSCRCSRSAPATMMARQGRDQAGLRGDGARRARSSIPRPTCRRSRATTRTRKGQMLSFPFNSSTHGVLVQQGRVREGGTRSQPAARRRGREVVAAMAKLKASGARVPVHHRLAVVDAARELLGVAQRAVPHQGERLRPAPTPSSCSTARCRSGTSRTCRTGSRRATSCTAAARTSRRPSSTAASAR